MPNKKENSNYAPHTFNIGKPLDKKEKELMLKKIHGVLRNAMYKVQRNVIKLSKAAGEVW